MEGVQEERVRVRADGSKHWSQFVTMTRTLGAFLGASHRSDKHHERITKWLATLANMQGEPQPTLPMSYLRPVLLNVLDPTLHTDTYNRWVEIFFADPEVQPHQDDGYCWCNEVIATLSRIGDPKGLIPMVRARETRMAEVMEEIERKTRKSEEEQDAREERDEALLKPLLIS